MFDRIRSEVSCFAEGRLLSGAVTSSVARNVLQVTLSLGRFGIRLRWLFVSLHWRLVKPCVFSRRWADTEAFRWQPLSAYAASSFTSCLCSVATPSKSALGRAALSAVARMGARHKSPLYAGTLYYKLNNWVTFAFEQSLYETNAVPGPAGQLPVHLAVSPISQTPSSIGRPLRERLRLSDGHP